MASPQGHSKLMSRVLQSVLEAMQRSSLSKNALLFLRTTHRPLLPSKQMQHNRLWRKIPCPLQAEQALKTRLDLPNKQSYFPVHADQNFKLEEFFSGLV